MSFTSPVWLLGLAGLVAASALYVWAVRRPDRYAVRYSNVDVLASVVERRRAWLQHVPAVLLVLALGALVVALARPTVTMAGTDERAVAILVVDVSGSMQAEDVEPTRLDAAKAAIGRFLERAPKELRVGVVAFSDEPQVVAAPTRDRDLVRLAVDLLGPQRGTAIGDALGRGVELARDALREPETGRLPDRTTTEDDEPLAAVLLLSDGFQTAGITTPEQSAAAAKKAGIPVSTIALGTDDGTIEINRDGLRRVIPVPPDRLTLAAVAETTGGTAYDAADAERLSEAYEQLGSKVGRVDEPREATVVFLAAGLGLLFAGALAAFARLPALP